MERGVGKPWKSVCRIEMPLCVQDCAINDQGSASCPNLAITRPFKDNAVAAVLPAAITKPNLNTSAAPQVARTTLRNLTTEEPSAAP